MKSRSVLSALLQLPLFSIRGDRSVNAPLKRPRVIVIFLTALEGSVNATQLTATAAIAALQFPSCD